MDEARRGSRLNLKTGGAAGDTHPQRPKSGATSITGGSTHITRFRFLEDEPKRIAGIYTLSSASIVLDELPDEIVKKLSRYPTVPAVLIGRLARDANFSGVGKLLSLDALARSFQHSDEVAAAVVLVDAKNDQAREFYTRYGFVAVTQTPNRMFLPMKTVEKLLKTDE